MCTSVNIFGLWTFQAHFVLSHYLFTRLLVTAGCVVRLHNFCASCALQAATREDCTGSVARKAGTVCLGSTIAFDPFNEINVQYTSYMLRVNTHWNCGPCMLLYLWSGSGTWKKLWEITLVLKTVAFSQLSVIRRFDSVFSPTTVWWVLYLHHVTSIPGVKVFECCRHSHRRGHSSCRSRSQALTHLSRYGKWTLRVAKDEGMTWNKVKRSKTKKDMGPCLEEIL